jgi:hypothetical protein
MVIVSPSEMPTTRAEKEAAGLRVGREAFVPDDEGRGDGILALHVVFDERAEQREVRKEVQRPRVLPVPLEEITGGGLHDPAVTAVLDGRGAAV